MSEKEWKHDPACYELAKRFLQDSTCPPGKLEKYSRELGEAIQDLIESYFEFSNIE